MNYQEKNIYQQIHPVRLIVDWGTGFYSCYLFWNNDFIPALIVAFIPSLIVAAIIFRFVDLEPYKNSRFGRYYKRIYNKQVDLLRFMGFAVMAIASWYHEWFGIAAGLILILYTWIYGIFQKQTEKKK
jgi:hypothetical protein